MTLDREQPYRTRPESPWSSARRVSNRGARYIDLLRCLAVAAPGILSIILPHADYRAPRRFLAEQAVHSSPIDRCGGWRKDRVSCAARPGEGESGCSACSTRQLALPAKYILACGQ